ncbi:MAG: cytochrome c, partial [Anaerolineales bacterium]|nr:cytochrome c [Anaerolineales bacterium]
MLPVLAVLLAGILLAGCSFSLAEDITPPPGSQMPSVVPAEQATAVTGPLYPLVAPNPVAGQPIYAEKCAPCHGETGLGDGERAADLPNPVAPIGVPDLARSAAPAQWYLVVTQGNLERFMPPFPSLTPRQVWDVIA